MPTFNHKWRVAISIRLENDAYFPPKIHIVRYSMFDRDMNDVIETKIPFTRAHSEFAILNKKHFSIMNDQSMFKSALLPNNLKKNRYSNILAYEKTRVILNNEVGDDYINANWTDSPLGNKAYICSQAPTNNTLTDFWKMVWEQEVALIVCLANSYEEDFGYFPKIVGQDVNVGHLKIKTLKDWVVLDRGVEIRRISIDCTISRKSHIIYHLHYLEWPDFGVPKDILKLLDFLELVYLISLKHHKFSRPVLVHCRAGIGRTGTFCSIYNALLMIRYHKQFNIPLIVDSLRHDRPGSVQTIEQYIFIYRAVYASLLRTKEIDEIEVNSGDDKKDAFLDAFSKPIK